MLKQINIHLFSLVIPLVASPLLHLLALCGRGEQNDPRETLTLLHIMGLNSGDASLDFPPIGVFYLERQKYRGI